MGFPRAIAVAQRQSLNGDVVEILDATEALHRQLGEVDGAHLVDLTAEQLSTLQTHVETAYNAIQAARYITDGGLER